MYSAFNTLQLELERLTLLRESMERSPSGKLELSKLDDLDLKIYQHDQAIQLLVRTNQAKTKHIPAIKIHKLGGGGLG